jgi:hypothetical protein
LTDENFVPENEGFFQRIAADNLKNDRAGDADNVLSSIGIFSDPLTAERDSQLLLNVDGND